jgi:hypothetical protein
MKRIQARMRLEALYVSGDATQRILSGVGIGFAANSPETQAIRFALPEFVSGRAIAFQASLLASREQVRLLEGLR